jgi:prophage tail gpP-like protein
MSEVTLTLLGTTYSGWESLRVERTLNSLCGDFRFSLTDFPFEDTRTIVPGAEAQIKLGTTPIITGYIDKVRRSRSAEQTTLEFNGRDRTSDLVDCSAIFKTNTWRRKTLRSIAEDICEPFGISVSMPYSEDPDILEFAIQMGESPFAAIERLCRAYSLLPISGPDGNLILTTVASDFADCRLEVGNNILQVAYELDDSGRYSNYFVKGQSRGRGSGWLTDSIQLKGQSIDLGIERYRPLVFVAEKHLSQVEIANRAAWEAQVRAGRAERTTIEVLGWEQTDIALNTARPWVVNELVSVVDEDWEIDAQLLITSVCFELTSTGGRLTTLELSPPEIYRANPTEEIELSRRSRVTPR